MPDFSEPYIVLLGGGSASGKSTLLTHLQADLSPHLTALSMDHYYRPRHTLRVDDAGFINYDHPDALDLDRMHHDLGRLQRGASIQVAPYTFETGSHAPPEQIPSRPLLVVEGLFCFVHSWLWEMAHLRVFLHIDPNRAFQRRRQRDVEQRGIPIETVEYQWNAHVRPAYAQYLEPYREAVDLVIPVPAGWERGYCVLRDHLHMRVAR